MADLIAKSPLAGTPAITLGALTLAEAALGPITSVSPLKGQEKALVAALKKLGLTIPTPNKCICNKAIRLIWIARNQSLLIGGDARTLGSCAALTDQSDGWAALSVTGPDAAEALMRLVPIDLHALHTFDTARTQLGHMQVIVIRTSHGFDLMVFRSMARTAWHEVETAMKRFAARKAALADQ